MSFRSILRLVVQAACICVLTLHPTQLRALARETSDFYSFEARSKRAEAIAKQLASCKRNKEDRRQLIEQVNAGMTQMAASSISGLCPNPQDSLSKFAKNMAAIKRATNPTDTGKFSYETSLDFMKALRLQVVKNAAISHVDAAYRYPFMDKITKVATAANKFCGGQCTPAEKEELARVIGSYRDGFNASKQKTYATAELARADLNKKLGEINQVHAKVFKELDDRVKKRDGAQRREVAAEKEKFGISKVSKPVIDTMVDTRKIEMDRKGYMDRFNAMERKEFQNRYSAEYNARMSQGVGLLMYSAAFTQEGEPLGKPGSLSIPKTIPDPSLSAKEQKKTGKRVASIEAAVGEILGDTEKLAANAKDQYKTYSSIDPKVRKMMNASGSSDSGHAYRFADPIKEMFKTNPVAAGQILVDHPEFASLVCDLTVSVESQDQSQRNKQTAMKVLSYGGMIVGGVLLATGILGPAGLALMTVSATAISTLTLVSVGMGFAGTALNTVNTLQRREDLKTEVHNTRMAGNSNTMQREVSAELLKEFKDEQGNLSSNGALVLQGALAVLPFKANAVGGLIGRATKNFAGNSKIVRTFNNTVSMVKDNERAMLAMNSLDYACGALGAGPCNEVMTAFSFLPGKRPTGQVAKIRGKTLDKLTAADLKRVTPEDIKSLTQAELLDHPSLMAKHIEFNSKSENVSFVTKGAKFEDAPLAEVYDVKAAGLQTEKIKILMNGREYEGELVTPDPNSKGLNKTAASMKGTVLFHSKELNDSYGAHAFFNASDVKIIRADGSVIQQPAVNVTNKAYGTNQLQGFDIHEFKHDANHKNETAGAGTGQTVSMGNAYSRPRGMSDPVAYGANFKTEEIGTHGHQSRVELTYNGNRDALNQFKTTERIPYDQIINHNEAYPVLSRAQDISNSVQTNLIISRGMLKKLPSEGELKIGSNSQGGVSLANNAVTVRYEAQHVTFPLHSAESKALAQKFEGVKRRIDIDHEIESLQKFGDDPDAKQQIQLLQGEIKGLPALPAGKTNQQYLDELDAKYSKVAVDEVKKQIELDIKNAQDTKIAAGKAIKLMEKYQAQSDGITQKDYLDMVDHVTRVSKASKPIHLVETVEPVVAPVTVSHSRAPANAADLKSSIDTHQQLQNWKKSDLKREQDAYAELDQNDRNYKRRAAEQDAMIAEKDRAYREQRASSVKGLEQELNDVDLTQIPENQKNWVKKVFQEEYSYQERQYQKERQALEFERNKLKSWQGSREGQIEKAKKDSELSTRDHVMYSNGDKWDEYEQRLMQIEQKIQAHERTKPTKSNLQKKLENPENVPSPVQTRQLKPGDPISVPRSDGSVTQGTVSGINANGTIRATWTDTEGKTYIKDIPQGR